MQNNSPKSLNVCSMQTLHLFCLFKLNIWKSKYGYPTRVNGWVNVYASSNISWSNQDRSGQNKRITAAVFTMGMCLFRLLVIRTTKTHLNTRQKQGLIKTEGSCSRGQKSHMWKKAYIYWQLAAAHKCLFFNAQRKYVLNPVLICAALFTLHL